MPPEDRPVAVLVFYHGPADRERAEEILARGDDSQTRCYKGYLRGFATPARIAELKASGFEVQVLGDSIAKRGMNVAGATPAAEALPQRRSKRSDPALKARYERLAQAAPPAVAQSDGWYRISVDQLMAAELRRKLDELGIQSSGYRDGVLQARLSTTQVGNIQKLSFVTDIQPYGLVDTVSSDLVIALEDHESAAPAKTQGLYDAIAHLPADVPSIKAALQSLPGVKIVGTSSTAVRFSAPVEDALLANVASWEAVRFLVPHEPPKLLSDHARAILGVDELNVPGASSYTGHGEIVGIFDSGIDDTHPDFGGPKGTPGSRIGDLISYRGCSPFDQVGHGTHVAGIIAGTGAASGNKVRGMAPEVSLIVVGMVNDQGQLELPVDLGELFKEAVSRGAKILNCSWARKFGTAYDAGSASVDEFVHQNPEVLVVLAAGNQGAAVNGEPAFRCVGAPATAKNVLTVGACGSDRTNFSQTWQEYDGVRFPAPLGALPLTPGLEHSAAISSTGPTDYEGVKPDLLAPGTYVLAPRATQLVGGIGWEQCTDFGGRYVFMHGTSMAAPAVAGCAAVLRQYLREARGMAAPSAALLRAILINAAKRLTGEVRKTPSMGYPDFDHGFGRLDLTTILPVAGAPKNRVLVFDDVANGSADALESNLPPEATRTGYRYYKITVLPGAKEVLRITLAWADPPGNGIQNDLQLAVRTPGNTWRYGNDEHLYANSMVLPQAPPPQPELNVVDRHNTVEHIRIEDPPPGDYTIRVWARNTIMPPQGYALAVSGEISDVPFRAP